MGKFLAILLVGSAVIGGAAMYYLQVYGFYRTLDPAQVAMAVTRADGVVEPLVLRDAEGIDSDSSPIRYRACATVTGDLPDGATLTPYPGAVPLTAPGWFDCFDAAAIGAALEAGQAQAYLSQAHRPWGVDRVIALFPDGRAYVWPQINRCGAELFDGKPLPEGCPPPPARGGLRHGPPRADARPASVPAPRNAGGSAMTTLDLEPRRLLHLRLHNIAARLGVAGWHPVDVRREGDHYIIRTDGHEVAVASALRWMMYRRGWAQRLERLSWQFGVGERVTVAAGDTVIDIGANIGEFSLAQAARGARAFPVEGDPRVFACLQRNVAGVAGITPVPALLWKEETDLTFYSEPRKADSSIFRPMSEEAVAAITLPATTLDLLAERHGLDRIDLVKCDAEGAEPEVIEGGRAVLARARQVAFDTGAERMGQETSDDVERLLRGMGFTVTHEVRRRRKITFGLRTA